MPALLDCVCAQVICYFERVSTDDDSLDSSPSGVPGSKTTLHSTNSVAGGESAIGLDENLSDSDTDNEWSDDRTDFRPSDV